jgi:hypothetical protein
MAAITLPKPGTKYGPCRGSKCGHTDCAATRRMAAALCIECHKPIGYDARFFEDEPGKPMHYACWKPRTAA